MYLISIYFDDKARQIMQNYINQVAKATGNTFMLDGNIRPHITLCGFQTKNEDKVVNTLEGITDELTEGQMYFASLGVFKGQVIYIQPILNEYLGDLSKKIYNLYKDI